MFGCSVQEHMIKVHEKAVRVIVGDGFSEFESLLENNEDTRRHHKNIQSLIIEMFKIVVWKH